MILDNLFAYADSTYSSHPNALIELLCNYTTNRGVLPPQTPAASSAPPTVILRYYPRRVITSANPPREEITPEYFEGQGITVSGKTVGVGDYHVEMLGASFVPSADTVTNIVFGAAGQVFVTMCFFGWNIDTGAGG